MGESIPERTKPAMHDRQGALGQEISGKIDNRAQKTRTFVGDGFPEGTLFAENRSIIQVWGKIWLLPSIPLRRNADNRRTQLGFGWRSSIEKSFLAEMFGVDPSKDRVRAGCRSPVSLTDRLPKPTPLPPNSRIKKVQSSQDSFVRTQQPTAKQLSSGRGPKNRR